MPRRAAVGAAVLLVAALAAGCSSSGAGADPGQPSLDDFADGTCREAAADVLAVGRQLALLGDGPTVDDPQRQALQTAQDRLRGVTPDAGPEVAERLEDLVLSLGLVRIRAEGGTYDGAITGNLQRSYDELVAVCTDEPPS